MTYSPDSSFDFSSFTGYTPATGFDFSVGAPTRHEVSFSQQWIQQTQTSGDIVLGQKWSSMAPADGSIEYRFQWKLEKPLEGTITPSQRWAKETFSHGDLHLDQSYRVDALTFSDHVVSQSWIWTDEKFYLLYAGQEWRLDANAAWTKVVSATAYLFALENGSDRAEIPISTFTCRLRSGEPSFLQATIPNAKAYAQIIAEYALKTGTEIVISAGQRWSDGSYTTKEIARTLLRNVQQYYGARSSSINLDGTDTRTYGSPKALQLEGASYYSINNAGNIRYRCSPNFDLKPGDTVAVNGDSFVAGEISWSVSANDSQMEVAEAVP